MISITLETLLSMLAQHMFLQKKRLFKCPSVLPLQKVVKRRHLNSKYHEILAGDLLFHFQKYQKILNLGNLEFHGLAIFVNFAGIYFEGSKILLDFSRNKKSLIPLKFAKSAKSNSCGN